MDALGALTLRIERCELELQASRGYIKALEYGFHAVIASHPDLAAMADMWNELLPDALATHGDETGPFLAALHEGLTVQSSYISSAKRHYDGA